MVNIESRYTAGQIELLTKYAVRAEKLKRPLSRADLLEIGYSRDRLRHYFLNLAILHKRAREEFPEKFDGVYDSKVFRVRKASQLSKSMKMHRRFVITSVVEGSPVHKGFLETLRLYCDANHAKLLLVPSARADMNTPAALAQDDWVFQETQLNSNFRISNIKISPKTINPTTSLGRIGQRCGSSIVASPKQFLEVVATGSVKLPHAVMTTGALTLPRYFSGKDKVERKADYLAGHDHVMGAIIAEIEDNNFFHFRQLQCEPNGNFADLGVYYQRGNNISHLPPGAIVIGDLHVTETDPTARQAWFEVAKHTGARRAIHHDFFSGVSINHHEEQDQIRRAQLMMKGMLSLENELRACAREIDIWTSKFDEIVIVHSNHHDFLSKHYIPKGMYQRDPHNLEFGSKLVAPMIQGHDPLRYAIEVLIGINDPHKVRWLKMDEEYKVGGIECGAHGHKGSNGSKGSPNTLERSYSNCIVGHSHTPKIIRGFWQVGTSSLLKLNYNEGPSSWLHTSGLVYPNGQRQLINSFEGKWRIK